MAGTVTAWDAADCSVMFGNTYITGLGEEMVKGSKDEDNMSASIGAQGDAVINNKNNKLGTVTVGVQVTSPQYKWLLKMAEQKAILPLWANNSKLGQRFGGTKAFIKKTPESSWKSEAEEASFEFGVVDYTNK